MVKMTEIVKAKPKFELYQYVQKKKGYKYPGLIVAVFETTKGEIRYVVEARHPDFEGMLHIFNEDQIESTIELMMKEIKDEINRKVED